MALPPPSHPSWARIKSTAWPHPSVVHIVPVPHLGELWKYYYVGGLHSIKRPITGREALIALAEGGLSMREGRTWGLGWPGRLKRLADRVADPTPSSATPNAASKYAGAMPFIRDRCIMRRLSNCGTSRSGLKNA